MAQKAFGILKKSKCIGAAATLTVVSALLIFAVIGGAARPGGAVPASAGAEESVVYALSYTDTASENGLSMLENDILYIRAIGLRFLLPDELETASGGVILIIESADGIDKVSALLAEYGARAVIAAGEETDDAAVKKLISLAEDGLVALAASIGPAGSDVELLKALAASRLAFMQTFGRSADVFVHTCSNVVCKDCVSAPGGFPFTAVVFLFGNGVNRLPIRGSGIALFNRIHRLPEWTIEDYFSAGLENR